MIKFEIDEWIRWAWLPNRNIRIYHPMKGTYFEFEGMTAELFSGLASGKDLDQIVRSIAEANAIAVSHKKLLSEAAKFMDRLVSMQILKVRA
jgi:hypothetical protein